MEVVLLHYIIWFDGSPSVCIYIFLLYVDMCLDRLLASPSSRVLSAQLLLRSSSGNINGSSPEFEPGHSRIAGSLKKKYSRFAFTYNFSHHTDIYYNNYESAEKKSAIFLLNHAQIMEVHSIVKIY